MRFWEPPEAHKIKQADDPANRRQVIGLLQMKKGSGSV